MNYGQFVGDVQGRTRLRSTDEAEAVINVRLLPGRDPRELVLRLQELVSDPGVELRFDPPTRPPVAAMTTLQEIDCMAPSMVA